MEELLLHRHLLSVVASCIKFALDLALPFEPCILELLFLGDEFTLSVFVVEDCLHLADLVFGHEPCTKELTLALAHRAEQLGVGAHRHEGGLLLSGFPLKLVEPIRALFVVLGNLEGGLDFLVFELAQKVALQLVLFFDVLLELLGVLLLLVYEVLLLFSQALGSFAFARESFFELVFDALGVHLVKTFLFLDHREPALPIALLLLQNCKVRAARRRRRHRHLLEREVAAQVRKGPVPHAALRSQVPLFRSQTQVGNCILHFAIWTLSLTQLKQIAAHNVRFRLPVALHGFQLARGFLLT